MHRSIGLVAGPMLFMLTLLFFQPEGMTPEARAVLASTLWIATWWISEAIPIPVTSLLPIVLFPLTGAVEIGTTSASYGHPLIFLYVGGFILAVSIEKWSLHKRIALRIISMIGTQSHKLILGFMMATAVMSMWISNTATTVMMLPIAMAMVNQICDGDFQRPFGKALMLAVAYAASIGGIATLIGTPTNLVLAGVISELYNEEIAFSDWFAFGFPISAILLIIAWLYLTRGAFKLHHSDEPDRGEELQRQIASLGKMSTAERNVAVVFAITAFCWITRSFLLEPWLPGISDTVIALGAAVLLFILPSGSNGRRLLDWETAVRIPWGIVLLFGGGLALASGFQSTGLAGWIGNQLGELSGFPVFVLLLIVIAAVNFLTEITSNVATASMILPILASLAIAIDVHPYILMVGATVASSCAFMLPVATPPNAIVFGSGCLQMSDMVRRGLWMNMISIAVLTLMVYFTLPLIWKI